MILTSAIPVRKQPPLYQEFKQSLEALCEQTNGPFRLAECDASWEWPKRGVYVFFDSETDIAAMTPGRWYVTRIGTVGDCVGSSQTLWNRLRAHRGNTQGKYEGGGNHRGSVFRRHIGEALIQKEALEEEYPHWGMPHSQLPSEVETTTLREQEHPLEQRVSERIRQMPFLVVNIPGEPGPGCERVNIERNLISLVAQHRLRNPVLKQGETLRTHSPTPEIAQSDLWNVDHVNELYSQSVVDRFRQYIDTTIPPDADRGNSTANVSSR